MARQAPDQFAKTRCELICNLAARYDTPLYLLEWASIPDRLKSLEESLLALPARHFFSYKTCPVPALLRSWRNSGRDVEVVSEFELLGAVGVGFAYSEIVVNGVNKHTWLHRHAVPGLTVIFDSSHEVMTLAETAARCNWTIGLRLHPDCQTDPDAECIADQFGMAPRDAEVSLHALRRLGLQSRIVHMHLRSNLTRKQLRTGLCQVSSICRQLELQPDILDCGGGLPAMGIRTHVPSESIPLTPDDLAVELRDCIAGLPSVREVWLENGRFVLAGAGTLIVRVHDVKVHGVTRFLICDGGRTNHAIVSDWETHRISTLPAHDGPTVPTTVCGPTCMAFDHLVRTDLPSSISRGDLVLWHDAGAYHIPWETRFSSGLAPVVYIDEFGTAQLTRPRESFNDYWSRWTAAS